MSDDSRRSVEIAKIGPGRFKATNERGGETFFGLGERTRTSPPSSCCWPRSPAAVRSTWRPSRASAAASTGFTVRVEGDKVRDEDGNHLTGIRLTFDVAFPEGAGATRRATACPAPSRCRVTGSAPCRGPSQLGADVSYGVA